MCENAVLHAVRGALTSGLYDLKHTSSTPLVYSSRNFHSFVESFEPLRSSGSRAGSTMSKSKLMMPFSAMTHQLL